MGLSLVVERLESSCLAVDMKYLPLLGALFLSASPAVAGDLIYLKCDVEMNRTYEYLFKDQVDVEENSLVEYFKVDTANSRMMMANTAKWIEAKIVDGIVVQNVDIVEDGWTHKGKSSMQISPPGRVDADTTVSNDEGSMRVVVIGVCQNSDASAFQKALQNPKPPAIELDSSAERSNHR